MRLASLACALVACGPPSIADEVVISGRHLVLHATPGLPVCNDSVAFADAFIEETAAWLGASPETITYYLHDGPFTGCRITGAETSDCTSGTTVHAATWPHLHELVHAIDSVGRAPAFLVEGLATGLGTSYPQLTPEARATAALPIDSVEFFARDAIDNYRAAGDFVVYLLHRFGVHVYRDLSERLLYYSEPNLTRRVFRDVTGAELDTVIDDWRTADPAEVGPLPLDRVRCAGPTVAGGNEHVACPSIRAPSGARLVQPLHRTVDLSSAGLVAITHTSAAAVSVQLSRCAPPRHALDSLYTRYPVDELQTAIQVLPIDTPGLYSLALDMRRELDDDSPVPLTWAANQLGPPGTTCAFAPTVTAPGGTLDMQLDTVGDENLPVTHDPILGPISIFALRIEGLERRVSVVPLGESTATVCVGPCDAPISCEEVTGNNNGMPTNGEPVYIEVRTPIGLPVNTLVRGQ